jgi:hypothetical protein
MPGSLGSRPDPCQSAWPAGVKRGRPVPSGAPDLPATARLVTPKACLRHDAVAYAPTRADAARARAPAAALRLSPRHELWSLRMGTWLGVGNDPQCTLSLGFDTFPFPPDLAPDLPAFEYAGDPRAERRGGDGTERTA